MLFRVALAHTGNPSAAEDVTSQVFVEALQGIERYRDRGKPISAWLLTIARQRSIDWRRRESRTVSVLPDRESGSMPDSSAAARFAMEILQCLPPDQSQVLTLRFVEGYSIEETADLLGRSSGAVKQLQRRALMNARLALTDTAAGGSA